MLPVANSGVYSSSPRDTIPTVKMNYRGGPQGPTGFKQVTQMSFHPRTTKNKAEDAATGAIEAIGDLSSVRSSHRNYPNGPTRGNIPNKTNFQGSKLSSRIAFQTPMSVTNAQSSSLLYKNDKLMEAKKHAALPKSARGL